MKKILLVSLVLFSILSVSCQMVIENNLFNEVSTYEITAEEMKALKMVFTSTFIDSVNVVYTDSPCDREGEENANLWYLSSTNTVYVKVGSYHRPTSLVHEFTHSYQAKVINHTTDSSLNYELPKPRFLKVLGVEQEAKLVANYVGMSIYENYGWNDSGYQFSNKDAPAFKEYMKTFMGL